MFWTELMWGYTFTIRPENSSSLLYLKSWEGIQQTTWPHSKGDVRTCVFDFVIMPTHLTNSFWLVGVLGFKLWPHNTVILGKLTNTAGLSVALSPRCRNIWFAHLSCRHMEGCVGSVGRRETWLHRACTHPDTHLVEREREGERKGERQEGESTRVETELICGGIWWLIKEKKHKTVDFTISISSSAVSHTICIYGE